MTATGLQDWKQAVGAHAMLCHNIDTKTGLVNGALGTVLSILKDLFNLTILDVCLFMVTIFFYVYREQFLLCCDHTEMPRLVF